MPTANFKVRFARIGALGVPEKTLRHWTKPLRTGTPLHAIGRAQSRVGKVRPAP